MKHLSLAMLPALFSPFAHAHPGEHQGNLLYAVAHLVSEPDHLAMALIAVVAGVAGAGFYRRRAATCSANARR